MDVLCHLTGLHFPSPPYHSSQSVSLTILEEREGERGGNERNGDQKGTK